jgi:hypothetical protein
VIYHSKRRALPFRFVRWLLQRTVYPAELAINLQSSESKNKWRLSMSYQRDPRRPDQPLPSGDPLDPPIVRDEPLMDRPIQNMNEPGGRSSMPGILGAIVVIALIVLAVMMYRGPSTNHAAGTASQDRATTTSTATPATK